MTGLAPAHLELLRSRAISDQVVEARGYRTVTHPDELRTLGFSAKQAACAPGMLIPRWALNGQPATFPQFRPDRPRRLDDHLAKYEMPSGAHLSADVLPASRAALRSGAECWISVEGHLKADAMVSAGVEAAVAVVGVWCWKTPWTLTAWEALTATPGRWFHLVCDSDFTTTDDVSLAVCRLGMHLKGLGARVRILHPPPDAEAKVGVDDHLAAGGTLDDLFQVHRDVVAEVLLRRPARPRRAYSPALVSEDS